MSYSHTSTDVGAYKTNIYRFEQTTCVSNAFSILFGQIDDCPDGRPSVLHYKGAQQGDFVVSVFVDYRISVSHLTKQDRVSFTSVEG